MKWFFALNETGKDFKDYGDLAKVAVYTALQKTCLKPHFIYDGGENELTEWMRKRNVPVIEKRTFLYSELAEEAVKRDNEGYKNIGAGAFLRLEIPGIMREHQFKDEFVLYTDVDVMFQSDVCETFEKLKPKYFAVAPEFFKFDYNNMNSGVMLMNIKSLSENEGVFREYVTKNLTFLLDNAFDQGAYRYFYGRNKVARKLIGNKWDKLGIEYNWKPYWGKSPDAKIIHFHGPKPHQTEMLLSGDVPKPLQQLIPMMNEAYYAYEKEWKENLEKANEND